MSTVKIALGATPAGSVNVMFQVKSSPATLRVLSELPKHTAAIHSLD